MSKRIGILGSGVVAKTLGAGFLKHGYSVMLGTRDLLKLAEWQTEDGKGAELGSFEEAASFGDIIVLAVKGLYAQNALHLAKAENLAGKTILDATNPIDEEPPENGVLKFTTSLEESLMEQLQRAVPDAHFVKCFNSVGSHLMVNPQLESTPSMFICGNHDGAKAETQTILDQFGWITEDMGMAESARAIEPLCILWCIPGFQNNQWAHAFKLVR